MVSKEIIGKFKNLYQKKFNISLTDEEATQGATDLVNLMKVLLKPDPDTNNGNSNQTERGTDETITAQPL